MNPFDHIQKTFALEHLPANIRASNFMARWPGVRRYQRWPVGWKFLPAEGSFFYEREGRRHPVKFNGRNLQFHALYESRYRCGYELETAMLLVALCRGQAAFLDIGSNWGYFSLLAASLPEFRGGIFAVEPNPRTFADLQATIEQSGLSARITACHFGMGRTACEMTVAEADEFDTGLSRLSSDGTGGKIPVKPVDALEFGPPVFIKIDAEGMELEILAGAKRTLAEAKPFVVLENLLEFKEPAKPLESIDFLEKNDYRVFIPVLQFSGSGTKLLATYGRDFAGLVDRHGPPQLAVVELAGRLRFLFGDYLNLLGVHASRVDELWQAGIINLGKS
jgi:FkbM family methyltransferase